MSTELHARARELEDQSAALRAELDALYVEITDDDGDTFMARMAERFRDERDQARRELAALKAELQSRDDQSSVELLEAERKLREAKATVGKILNNPTSTRPSVQSALLLLNERI